MNEQVHQIFNLNEPQKFTEDQAYQLVELLLVITNKSKDKITSLKSQIDYNKNFPKQVLVFEKKLNTELQKWSEKVRRLGGIPISLFQVKIPAKKEGFFLWEHPKLSLEFHY